MSTASKAARREIEAYHQQKLAELFENVRQAIQAFDAGRIDALEVDHVVHVYGLQPRELFTFVNGYYPSSSKLPQLLAMIDDERRGAWYWKPNAKVADQIQAKLAH